MLTFLLAHGNISKEKGIQNNTNAMSRKNEAKRARRLANTLMQPEQMGAFKVRVPKNAFLQFCRMKNMSRLFKLINELPNSQYQAFWQVISFFVLKPDGTGYTEVTDDDVILDKIKEIDATLASPYSAYAMKREIHRVHEANKAGDKEKLPKGGMS